LDDVGGVGEGGDQVAGEEGQGQGQVDQDAVHHHAFGHLAVEMWLPSPGGPRFEC